MPNQNTPTGREKRTSRKNILSTEDHQRKISRNRTKGRFCGAVHERELIL